MEVFFVTDDQVWRSCGSCKKSIALGARYFACNVSTCAKSVYCTLDCFSMHVPIFRHKDAWAEEKTAPKSIRLVVPASAALPASESLPKDVLIVASKLKAYIDAKSGLNTSASVLDRLSEIVRLQCDKAILHAKNEGRKTVLDRDFYL